MLNAQGEPSYCIDFKDEHGRRKQVRTNACTERDAARMLRAALDRIDKAGALGVPKQALESMTFARFTDLVYLPAIEQKVRASTYERYVNLARHLTDYFGTMALASIEPLTIDDYFKSRGTERTNQGVIPKPEEFRNRRFQLMAIMKHSIKKRLIPSSPVEATDRIEYTPAPRVALTLTDEERILGACPAWLAPIVTFGIYGGMRMGEIVAIRWEHLQDGLIYIPEENSKTGTARHVPLTREMEAALAPLRARRLAEGSPAWMFWNAPRKSAYTAHGVSLAYRRVARSLGIKTSFHATRVTFITDARESGKITDAALMKIVGHSTGRMLDHYTKVKPEHLKGLTDGLRRQEDAESVQNEASGT
jgi:integrase